MFSESFRYRCCWRLRGNFSTPLRPSGVQPALLWAQVSVSEQVAGHQVTQVSFSSVWFSGASLFWVDPGQPLPHEGPPPTPTPPPLPSPTSSPRPPSHTDLSIIRPGGGGEDSDINGQECATSYSGEHR